MKKHPNEKEHKRQEWMRILAEIDRTILTPLMRHTFGLAVIGGKKKERKSQ